MTNTLDDILAVMLQTLLGFIVGATMALVYFGVTDFKTTDRDFIKAIDNNMTLKEYFYYVDEDTYKLHYTDWKQFESVKQRK